MRTITITLLAIGCLSIGCRSEIKSSATEKTDEQATTVHTLKAEMEEPALSIPDKQSLSAPKDKISENPIKNEKDSTTYYPSGKIKEKGQVVNGVFHGPYTILYENGNVMVKCIMKNGQPEGILTRFHESGAKVEEHVIEEGIVKSSRAFQSLDDLFYLFRDEATRKLGLQSKSTGREVLPPDYIGIYKMNNEYYTIVKDQEQYGLMHHSGKVAVPAIYDEEIKDFAADKPFPVKKSGKYGFLNAQGKQVVPFVYDWASNFSDRHFGYATVRKDGKQGMIDKEGEVVIPIIYDDLGSASEGLVSAKMNGKSGFIDRHGRAIVPFIYNMVRDFSEGLALVALINTQNGYETKHGYIDKTGKVVIPIIYEDAYDFENGKALVMLGKPSLSTSEAESGDRANRIFEKTQERPFYIDKTGARIE